MSASDSSSPFSDVEEDVVVPSTYSVEVENLSEDEKVLDPLQSSLSMKECCLSIVQALRQQDFQPYDNYANALAHLNGCWPSDNTSLETEYHKNRNEVYKRFHRVHPLTPDMHQEWIAGVNSTLEKKQLYEQAFTDYWSVELTVEYLQFLYDYVDDFSQEFLLLAMAKAQETVGYHYSQGHEVWQKCREIQKEIAEDVNTALDDLYSTQLHIPLQENEFTLSEYRTWVSYTESVSNDKFTKTEKQYHDVILPLQKKLSRFETDIQANIKSIINSYRYKFLPQVDAKAGHRVLTCLYERLVASNCLDPGLWQKYVSFVRDTDAWAEVSWRAVRNMPFDSTFWIEWILARETGGDDVSSLLPSVQEELFPRMQSYVTDASHGLYVLLVLCDTARRNWMQGETEGTTKEVFDTCAAFIRPFGQHGYCQLVEYKAKCFGEMELYQEIIQLCAQVSAEETLQWILRYYHTMRRCRGVEQVRSQVLERNWRLLDGRTDLQRQLMDEWYVFERENGSLEHMMNVRRRVETLEIEPSRKRKMEETTKSVKKQKREQKDTLVVSVVRMDGLPPHATDESVRTFMQQHVDGSLESITSVRFGNAGKGGKKMALVSLSSDEIAKQLLSLEGEMDAYPVRISDGKKKECLFLGGLKDINKLKMEEEELKVEICNCLTKVLPTGNVQRVQVLRGRQGQYKNFALVEMDEESGKQLISANQNDLQSAFERFGNVQVKKSKMDMDKMVQNQQKQKEETKKRKEKSGKKEQKKNSDRSSLSLMPRSIKKTEDLKPKSNEEFRQLFLKQ